MAAVATAAAVALSASLLLLGLSCGESSYIPYNTSQGIVPGKINVHLVPHTHDDVGWLKTVDQYYVGANNSIRGACVQNVLDSLIPALLADENRKFVYVEMAFFQRWWREQSKRMQAIVKELVRSGQLDFINGGMCMHDEASTHYIDMIDQTTLGHQFIKQEFDQTPRIGWQIDPFGHSAVQAYLLGAEVGFDALFFARIDYQDRARRKEQKTLEVIWHGSKSLGSSSQIFTGIFPVHYEPPPGFSFEVNDISPVVQDDETLYDYNVEERVNDFVNAAVTQANVTRTNHIMWTMGTDFRYQYANSWFRQMDKLIHYVNKDGRVNALYSTPSIYTDTKFASNDSWPLKMEDFFPYADRPNAYWTGYFTSRPGLKGFVRELSGYFLAARQLEFLIGKTALDSTTDALADALAIAQHHDAVSGTERQHVADDYAKRLYTGYKEAASLVKFSLACLTESKLDIGCHNITTKLQQCPLMNLSYCPASEITLSRGKSLVIVVYNPLGWNREDIIRIPVVDEAVNVADSEGKLIESQLVPIKKESVRLRNIYVNAYLGVSPSSMPKFWLVFPATIPPLGFHTYFVTKAETTGSKSTISKLHSVCSNESEFLEIGHGNIKLKYEINKGRLIQYTDNKNSVNLSVEQSYSYYTGDDGSGYNPQASGAYIFRPNRSVIVEPQKEVPLNVLRGPIVDELHQAINPWISQITRVYTKKDYVEFDFTIGPIPIDDEIGKEIVTQITTGMKTNGTIYTDSNGRDFIKRIRNYRSDWDLQVSQPIAGNYYPVNLGIYMEDYRTELSVLVDRAVGGGSIVDGQIELMLHRRLLHDDSRGVGEVLNETVCALSKCEGLTVKGKFYLRVDRPGEGAEWRRRMGQEIYSPFLLAFSVQEEGHWMDNHVPHFSALDSTYSLPPNVAILTLQELHGGTVLLRLAHLYEIGEDEVLSAMTTVEMKKLFPSKKISKVVEMNLSANQERKEMEKRRLFWKVENPPGERPAMRGGTVDPSKLIVELGPMEIRTFLVTFEYIFLPRGM